MHCLKIFQARYCCQHQSGSMVTHGTKHKVVFLKGEKRSTGDICAHILTGKVIERLVKQHIGLMYFLCNMEASNILDKIINISIYLMKIKLSMTITGSFSRCACSNLMHLSLGGQLLVVF